MSILKTLSHVIALAAAAAALLGCYTLQQALHQNDLYNTRRRVDLVLSDPGTKSETRRALMQVRQILDFAAKSGLRTDGAYEYLIVTPEPVVSYIIQAAQPTKMEFVTWWFPVVGEVPYLGFFRKEERDAKARELRKQGLDVAEGGAGAFSSLGWFDDPIFSSMLERSDEDLAHLFFHELTHRTLWVAGSTEFNENLAEFIASDLTVDFLRATGRGEQIDRYQAKHGDKNLFRAWLLQLKKALEEIYHASSIPPEEILKRKDETIAKYLKPPLRPVFKVVDFLRGENWNNASILGAALYAPDEERFLRAQRCSRTSNAREFLLVLTRAVDEKRDPFAALDNLCRASGLRPETTSQRSH